jgi:RimJ/RimL family protein N-acetyltransferase
MVGGAIQVRDFRLDDVDDATAIVGDDRVTHSLSFVSKDRAATEKMLSVAIESSRVKPRTEYYLAIAHNESGRVVGFIRLGLGGVKAAKVGYAIHADHWRKGYATSAVHMVCDFGFRGLDLHRITAATAPDNAASIAVLTRLGFTQEGRLRDHVHTNGAWRDSILFSLLVSEWKPPKSADLRTATSS